MKNLRLCRRFFCFLRRGEEYAKMPSGKGVGAMWYVYMLRCGDGSLYTGSTTDVARRLQIYPQPPAGDAGLHRGSTRPLCCPAPGSGHQKAAPQTEAGAYKKRVRRSRREWGFSFEYVSPKGKGVRSCPCTAGKTKRRESDEKKRSGTNAGGGVGNRGSVCGRRGVHGG